MELYFPLLKQTPLFSGIDVGNYAAMLNCLGATLRAYGKHEIIFLAGAPASSIGIVCEGEAHIVKEDALGNRNILSRLEAGDLFGETFSCAHTEHLPVSVLSVSESRILFLDYRRVITVCTSACSFHSRLVANMLTILAQKNVELDQKIEMLSKRTTREKLLTYLSTQSQQAGSRSFSIPYNRQELADFLCVDRSAMSAELGRLRREGVLHFERNHFELLSSFTL